MVMSGINSVMPVIRANSAMPAKAAESEDRHENMTVWVEHVPEFESSHIDGCRASDSF